MKIKIGIILITLTTIMVGTLVYAEQEIKLTQLEKTDLQELRNSGNREFFTERLNELRIDRANKPKLNAEQKQIINQLRESGNKEVLQQQLQDWGIKNKAPKKNNLIESLSQDQKERLYESSNRKGLKEYYAELGLVKKRQKNNIRKKITGSLTQDQKKVLFHARVIAKEGDNKTAEQMIRAVFDSSDPLEDIPSKISRFFRQLFKF